MTKTAQTTPTADTHDSATIRNIDKMEETDAQVGELLEQGGDGALEFVLHLLQVAEHRAGRVKREALLGDKGVEVGLQTRTVVAKI